jgi:hypothetical protein
MCARERELASRLAEGQGQPSPSQAAAAPARGACTSAGKSPVQPKRQTRDDRSR